MKKFTALLMMSLTAACSSVISDDAKPISFCAALPSVPKLTQEEKQNTSRRLKELLLEYKNTRFAWCDYEG